MIIGFINVIFTVVNVVYQLLYFVERPRRGLRDAVAVATTWSWPAALLANARRKQRSPASYWRWWTCKSACTGTHYHDPFIPFLLFAISCWWHTNTTQRAGKFLTISACMFVSFACVCASIPYWQRALCGARACGATLVACYTQATNTTRHTQQQVQRKELLRCWLSPKPTWSTGFSENHNFFEIIFIQQDVVSSLSYYNTQMIHNNTFLLAVKAGNT